MSGQVALVTGSSRGIGLGAARHLAKAGFSIAVNSVDDDEELDRAFKAVKSEGVSAVKAAFDVSNLDAHEGALKGIEQELGPLTTLVNNAGVGVLSRGDILDVTKRSYDRCMSINTRGLFFLTQKFARLLTGRKRDKTLKYSIINVTSANAVAVSEQRGEYCASKAAASMISRAFAVRLGHEDISVFDIQPGLIETEMTKGVIDAYRAMAENGTCLMPRVGQPDDLGMVIASLASDKLPYVTGQSISVDGGMLVSRF